MLPGLDSSLRALGFLGRVPGEGRVGLPHSVLVSTGVALSVCQPVWVRRVQCVAQRRRHGLWQQYPDGVGWPLHRAGGGQCLARDAALAGVSTKMWIG